MGRVENLFVTQIYQDTLGGKGSRKLLSDLERASLSIAEDDAAGKAWCRENGYFGYTSYSSLADLPDRFPEFGDLVPLLDAHVARFAANLDLDLGGRRLVLDNIWINVLRQGGYHTAHIHPHSVISGTLYIAVPEGAGSIRFEDPRLPLMMAAPPRKARAKPINRTFQSLVPKRGTLFLWESFLRHEVPANQSKERRISISFNYAWS
jgi:uncharacterized protein (TIGR02466 family)